MNREIVNHWNKIFTAISEEKPIEVYFFVINEWHSVYFTDDDMNKINLCYPEHYRIKPELEYIPFEYTDNEFMHEKVRRKGDAFKNEIWIVVGYYKNEVIILLDWNNPSVEWKRFDSMFEEWEFSDGKPFGKLKK